jgi:lysozyme
MEFVSRKGFYLFLSHSLFLSSNSSGCCTGTMTAGYCPGSSDIQCCTSAKCSTPSGSGTCIQTSKCSGKAYAGYCTGPSDLQCCVAGTPPSSSCTYSCTKKAASSWSFGKNGLDMLTHFEGFSSTCYKDSVGIWTIGYGHACQDSSDNLPQYGVTCTTGKCSGSLTDAQAKEVLDTDVNAFASCVRNSVKVSITQNQFDSLVSMAYNIGCGGFQSSTLLSKLNAGTLTDQEAQYQFTRWHSSCIAGLERRRFTESQLFSTCSTNFGCTKSSCSISNNYPKCASNCQYCSACGGCSGSTYSLPTCTGGK